MTLETQEAVTTAPNLPRVSVERLPGGIVKVSIPGGSVYELEEPQTLDVILSVNEAAADAAVHAGFMAVALIAGCVRAIDGTPIVAARTKKELYDVARRIPTKDGPLLNNALFGEAVPTGTQTAKN